MDKREQGLEKNFISAVVYLNNATNEESLRNFLLKLQEILFQNFKKFEIICVDDATDQRYIDVVKSVKQEEVEAMTLLHMSFYQGIELAMNAGRDLAIGDYVIEFDVCEWNFPDTMLMEAYREVMKNYDIVCCADDSRKHITSKWFYTLFNRFSRTQYKLESDNFRILSRRGINRICSLHKAIPYRKALYANCGLKYKVLHYVSTENSRKAYSHKVLQMRRKLAVESLILFTDIGSKISFFMTVLMFLGTIFLALYSLIIFLCGIAVTGWTTTMLFLSFGFFVLFALVSIAIQYLILILDLIFKKEKYLYEAIERL